MRTAIFYRTEGEVEWKLLYNGGKIVTEMEVAKELFFTDPRFNRSHLVQMARYEDIMKEEQRKLNPKVFTLEDLRVLSPSTIQVESLTESIIDELFASNLQDYLEESGIPVHWVSLDDMGFISIFCGERVSIKEEWKQILVDGINKLYNKI